MAIPNRLYNKALNLTVLIAGLGYFIDSFDYFLYSSIRVPSLTELGLSGNDLTHKGITILNVGNIGTIIGSLVWGMLGDKIGRKKALLGSIFLYSIATIATGFASSVSSYTFFRFVIGFGVAGELGLGATLVGETVQTSKRTFALAFFSIMGLLGVCVSGISVEFSNWRTCCFIGGGLGLLLLLLRSLLFESQIFEQAARAIKHRGRLRDLFLRKKNLQKYIFCVLIMTPTYLIAGIILTLSPEIAKETGVGPIKANIAVILYFMVSVLGDLIGAALSEYFKSRRIVLAIYIAAIGIILLILVQKLSLAAWQFYALCATLGLFNLWALCGTIVIEQFPTALRATASTSSLNMARAGVVLANLVILNFRSWGLTNLLMAISLTMICLALIAVCRLSETYGDTLEENSPLI